MKTEFVNDAKVMAKGQVTIPKNVREALGIDVGDRVTFIVDGSDIKIMNSAVYAGSVCKSKWLERQIRRASHLKMT